MNERADDRTYIEDEMAYRAGFVLPALSVGALAPFAALLWLPLGACDSGGSFGTSGVDGGTTNGAGACVFATRVVYECPGQPAVTTAWETDCRDGVDCATVQAASTTDANGCTRKTEIQGAQAEPSSCSALGAGGADGSSTVLDAAAPSPCTPGDDAGAFAPAWHPPRVNKGQCTLEQIDAFRTCIDDVDTTAQPASCTRWYSKTPAPADATCLACLVSKPGDPTWGPFVGLPTATLVNVPGCMAIAEQLVDGSGCAGALAASQACGRFVCAASCTAGATDPTAASLERTYELQCERASEQGACLGYTVAAQCAGKVAQGDGGTDGERACLGVGQANTKDAVFEAVATAFCGP